MQAEPGVIPKSVLFRRAFTDENGAFAFTVDPGAYSISVVGGEPGGIHQPEMIEVGPNAPGEIVLERRKGVDGAIIGASGAPFKANQGSTFDYSLHTIGDPKSPKMCMRCHRPHRETEDG